MKTEAVLTPEEEARCVAMSERAAVCAARIERYQEHFHEHREKHEDVVATTLAIIVAILAYEELRVEALGCSPDLNDWEAILTQYGILNRTTVNEAKDATRRSAN